MAFAAMNPSGPKGLVERFEADRPRPGRRAGHRPVGLLAASLAAAVAGVAGCGGDGSERRSDPLGSLQRQGGDDRERDSSAQGTEAQASPQQLDTGQLDVSLGTFRPRGADAEGAAEPPVQGRLPAEGDRSAYVAAVTLFPGVARIDPNIGNPYEGDPEAIAAGERHFEAFNCSGCHAPLGGGGMGPPLSDDQWIHGSEPAQIYLSILHGRADGMPAWSSMLPQRTIWEMVAYVESLSDIEDYAARKGFESDPASRFAEVEPEPPPQQGVGGRQP